MLPELFLFVPDFNVHIFISNNIHSPKKFLKMKANLRFIVALLVGACGFSETFAQDRINVNNATAPCGATDIGDCSLNGNQANLSVTSPQPDPMIDPDYVPRFEAFWVMGDGNFIELLGNDVPSDAASLNVTGYNFPLRTGEQVTTTAYLTGKYTNTTPPPEYRRNINIGPPNITTSPTFLPRVDGGETMDIHRNHDFRKDHLTAFVISYPNVQSGRVLFFFNGQKNPSTQDVEDCAQPVLLYETSNIAKYFKDNGMTNVDRDETMGLPSPFGGLNFDGGFVSQIQRAYRDVLAYPLETVSPSVMPSTYVEKRQFPVLKANPDITISLTQVDSIHSVLTLLLGPSPLNQQQNPVAYQQVSQILNGMGLDLNIGNPIASDDKDDPWYIIGAQEAIVPYRAGFDPNQLTVENIQPENDFYRVTFSLSICNAGAGDVLNEKISISYPPGAFWDFQYPITQGPAGNGYNYNLVSQDNGEWNFNIQMFLHGVPQPLPGQPHEEVCQSITFTALTDCEGVRSLWEENGGQVMQACVVFMESFGQEEHCNYNTPIKSDQFKNADGSSICATDTAQTCPPNKICNWWYCLLLLLIILLILLWLVKSKYIPWLSKLFS